MDRLDLTSLKSGTSQNIITNRLIDQNYRGEILVTLREHYIPSNEDTLALKVFTAIRGKLFMSLLKEYEAEEQIEYLDYNDDTVLSIYVFFKIGDTNQIANEIGKIIEKANSLTDEFLMSINEKIMDEFKRFI